MLQTQTLMFLLIISLISPKKLNGGDISNPEDKIISNIALGAIVGYFGWNIIRSIVKVKDKKMFPEVKAELKIIQFIATTDEIREIKSLRSPDELDAFTRSFWKNRDPSPQTAINEFRIEHEKRVKFCNENFTTGLTDGGSTDMGRVYILYGAPFNIFRDEIDTSSEVFSKFSPNVYPLEVWVYNFPSIGSEFPTIFSNTNYGGTVFVFMDLQKIGEYSQIYSNKPNEYIDNRVYK